jgi:hypothetical protein
MYIFAGVPCPSPASPSTLTWGLDGPVPTGRSIAAGQPARWAAEQGPGWSISCAVDSTGYSQGLWRRYQMVRRHLVFIEVTILLFKTYVRRQGFSVHWSDSSRNRFWGVIPWRRHVTSPSTSIFILSIPYIQERTLSIAITMRCVLYCLRGLWWWSDQIFFSHTYTLQYIRSTHTYS